MLAEGGVVYFKREVRDGDRHVLVSTMTTTNFDGEYFYVELLLMMR